MCGSAKPPAPISPYEEANAQQGLNLNTMESGQAASQVNQFNPFGSQIYNQTGTGPNGVPTYTMTQNLSPVEQGLLGQYQGFQGEAGGAGANLMHAAEGMYGGGVPNFMQGANSMTNQMMGNELNYLTPFFNNQSSQLNTQLANQGLTPTDQAYKNAMMNLNANQGQTVSGFLAQAEPMAFQQAVQQYQLPFQEAAQLSAAGAPQMPSFSQMQNYSAQPANLIGAVGQQQQTAEQQYQAQLQQQSAMMNGIAGLGSSAMLAGALSGAGGAAAGGGALAGLLPLLGMI